MKLVIERGEAADQTLSLEGSAATIGRGRESDIVLPEKGISRQHAQLQRQPEGWVLVDLGSTNGTRLNGQSLAPHKPEPLHGGDRIGIGSCVLVVLDIETPELASRGPVSPRRQTRLPLLVAEAVLLVAILAGLVIILVVALRPQIEDLTPTPMNQLEQLVTALPVPTELQDMVTSVVPLISTRLPIFPTAPSTTPPPPAAGLTNGAPGADRRGAEP
jgi:hypothetical protein